MARKAQNWKRKLKFMSIRFRNGEGAARNPEGHDGSQEQGRTRQGVQEELERGVPAIVSAPDCDEQIHGDEHGFPEHVEQDQIQCTEHAEHRRGHEQQAEVEFLLAFADVGPGTHDAQRQTPQWSGGP